MESLEDQSGLKEELKAEFELSFDLIRNLSSIFFSNQKILDAGENSVVKAEQAQTIIQSHVQKIEDSAQRVVALAEGRESN